MSRYGYKFYAIRPMVWGLETERMRCIIGLVRPIEISFPIGGCILLLRMPKKASLVSKDAQSVAQFSNAGIPVTFYGVSSV